MPAAWSDKDERQYDHVKESELERGRSEDRAEEIAARTVNKTRSRQGRTKAQQQARGGSKSSASSDNRTKKELYDRAKQLHIEGRSKMSKFQLEKAIRSHK